MTAKELINAIAKATELKPADARIVLKTITNAISEGLKNGETIELRGLGTFEIRKRKSKPAQIIKTRTTIRIPARRVPYFKPGKVLKKLVNKNA